MKATTVAVPTLLALFFVLILSDDAQTSDFYKWVDENGAVHFVDSPGKIPAKYQSKAESKDYEPEPDRSTVLYESVRIDIPQSKQKAKRRKIKTTPSTGSAYITNVTDSTFDREVLRSDKPVLVEFWAIWCGPCKRVAPIVHEFAEENRGKVKVVKVDIDHEKQTSKKYGVSSIPTLMLFRNGEAKNKLVGVVPKSSITRMLNSY